jgi:hypothetical protein
MKPSPIALRLGREFLTVKKAAMLLGVSEQAVHAACRRGRIRFETIGGVRVLQRDGLAARWHGSSQRRRVVPVDVEPGPDWPALAAKVNDFLGPDWPAPPWSGDQLNTVAMCLALSVDAGNSHK